MAEARVTAVCRLHQLLPDRGNGVTGIDKRPVEGPVRVRPLGLHGDVQVDRQYHGGADQAVYVFADEDAARIGDHLGRRVPPGLLGENVRTTGLDVTGAVLGERWRVGEKLLLEVTGPRVPCGTFERRIRTWLGPERDRAADWRRRFTSWGAPGAYLRVLRAGDLRADDPVEVVHRPAHGVTIGRWFGRYDPADAAVLLDADAAGEIRASADLRDHADRAVKRAARAAS